jgi:hypothetical protein
MRCLDNMEMEERGNDRGKSRAMREGRDMLVKGSKVRFEKGCECRVSIVELSSGLEATAPHDKVCGVIVGEAKGVCRCFGI